MGRAARGAWVGLPGEHGCSCQGSMGGGMHVAACECMELPVGDMHEGCR